MARIAKVVKKAPVVRSSKASKLLEEKHIGAEIKDWSKVTDVKSAMAQNFNHYNYFYDYKDAVKWVEAWIRKNMTKTDLKKYQAAESWRTSTTLGGLCLMHMDGAPLPEKDLKRIAENINAIVAIGAEKLEATKPVSNVVAFNPGQALKDKTMDFIAEFEEVLDKWKENLEFSFYDEMKKSDVAYNTAKAVFDYYTPLLNELAELVEKKTSDLAEAYDFMGIRERKQYMNFVKKIVDEAELYMNSKKAVRKTRVKKTAPKSAQVAKVVYQKECPTYKVASVEPLNIVGASEVYVFNTKYRVMSRLIAGEGGFSVKGTTIQNLNEELSTKKKLRKPEEFFKEASQTTKSRLSKIFDAVKTTAAAANGRLSAETVIYKAH